MRRYIILTAIVLLVASELIQSIKANDAEGGAEPAAEPYSFSYSAESTGGFSSREESGDASGRVQGFYIIMGDDQRERRVDYVADKDGYRATISTNEIGTRSQSSADAQYQARLPSKEQLDQAKTTLEEYKFLEQQHEIELQRQLNVQQTGQQQRQSNSNQNAQSWLASSANRQQPGQSSQSGQSGQASWMSSSSSAQQQQQRWSQSNQANSLRPNQPQAQLAQFEQATNLTLASSTSQDDEGWRSAKLLATNQQQQQPQQLRPRGPTETELAASITEGTSAPFVAQAGAGFRQQTNQQLQTNFQAPTWQSSSGQTAGFSASAQATNLGGADLGLQRQFKQQFMQQAQQLAAEDYPRQTQGPVQQIETNRQVLAATTSAQQQQQQPQEEPVAPQLPQWQQQSNLGSDQRSQGQETFSQINQQQNNIIDEVSGEQVEPNLPQQIGGVGQFVRQEGAVTGTVQSDITTGQPQAVPIQPQPIAIQAQPEVQQQQQQAQQQTYKSYDEQTTTTRRPVPSGFLAIDLGRQEVELKPETPGPSYQTSSLTNQRVEVDQVGGDVQQQQQGNGVQTTDYQQQQFQVDQRQEQQPQRPKSIQQIIQSGGTKQQQQQQQMVFVRPTIATTQQPTTTQARLEPEITTTFQPIVTTTSTTTRAPQAETTARITTTSTNSQAYSSFAPSSAAPVERFTTGLLEQTTRKPAFIRQQQQQQQQFINKGTKSGVQGARRVVIGPKLTPSKPIEQPLVETPSIPTSTTREQFSTTRRPSFLAQSVGTSQQSELVSTGQQTTQQVPYQSFNNKQRTSGLTSERTTSTTSTTVQPAQFETSTPQAAPYQPQSEVRQPIAPQPQWTGAVKGTSKTGANKRQFWQQSNVVAANGQRTSSLQANGLVAGQNSQASVDYAPQTREFGSRIQGRSN